MHLNLKDGVIYSVMEFCETISSYSADTIMVCADMGFRTMNPGRSF